MRKNFACGNVHLWWSWTLDDKFREQEEKQILVFTTLYHCHHFYLLKQSLFSSNFETSVCVIFAVFWYPRDTPCWYGPQAWRAKTGSKWGKRNLVMGERQLKINVKGNNCKLNLPTRFSAERIWSRIAEKLRQISLRTHHRTLKDKF